MAHILINTPSRLLYRLNPSVRQVHYLRSSLFVPTMLSSIKQINNENKLDTATKSISCQIMENNAFLSESGPGLQTFLPLGKRVLNKLTNLIRDEMDKINAQEIEMPALCDLNLWNTTGRNELMGSELFRLEDRHNRKLCLCPTHEEVVTSLVARHASVLSAHCLGHANQSLRLYQITRKYRDESRPKHALLRAREFLMKDLYTFHTSDECAEKTYENVCKAYETVVHSLIFNTLSIS